MATGFRHAAIVGKFQARGIRPVLEEIAHFLVAQGLEVAFERETAEATGVADFDALSPEQIGRQCDLAIVIGGDGTMLGIARELSAWDIPLVGINQGRLGFITDIPMASWTEALAPIVAGRFEQERRSMLQGDVWRDGQRIYSGSALNEVVVSRGAGASMLEVRVEVGNEFVANIRSDGLIVSTPTGSTAYALSAGGPIVHPAIAGWIVLPIASHTLSNRPIVLPDLGEVRIGIVGGRDVSANFDMHSIASLMPGDQVQVRRSAHTVRFLHPLGWSYYATLRRKLRWYEGVV